MVLKLYKATQMSIVQQILTHPGAAVFAEKVPKVSSEALLSDSGPN
jgi:hypothetical protein